MGLARNAGGKLHLVLHTGSRPIAIKYHEGKVKRTLKSKVNVLEERGERERKRGRG